MAVYSHTLALCIVMASTMARVSVSGSCSSGMGPSVGSGVGSQNANVAGSVGGAFLLGAFGKVGAVGLAPWAVEAPGICCSDLDVAMSLC